MLNAAIAALCAGISVSDGQSLEACEKVFQAVSIQYGVDKKAKHIEKKVTKTAEKMARRHLPEEAALVMTGMYTVLIAQEIRFSTRKIPFIQSTAISVRPQTVMLTLSWNL